MPTKGKTPPPSHREHDGSDRTKRPCADGTGDWRKLLPQLEGLPLLPCGAGKDHKAPLDPATGHPATGWQTTAYSPQQIAAMNGKVRCVGTRCGPDAAGLLAVDLDGDSAIGAAMSRGIDPAETWTIGRTTAGDRVKVAYRVPERLWPLLQQKGKVKHPTGTGEQIEVFWSTGQVVVLGEHITSGGAYTWTGAPGCIATMDEAHPAWPWLLQLLGVRPPERQQRPPAGATATDAIPLPDLLSREHSRLWQQGAAEGSRNDDLFRLAVGLLTAADGAAAEGLRVDGTPEALALDWAARCSPPLPEREALQTIRSAQQQPRTPDPGLPDRIEYQRSRKRSRKRSSPPPPPHAPREGQEGDEQGQPAHPAPFRVLGWNVKLDTIWVQTGQTGTVAAIPPTKNGLQRIAPIAYWEALYPGRTGCGWDAAISSVCSQAHDLSQTFTPDRIRGRGVWLDNNRVVWHLGNRLEVDGQLQPLTALRDTGWTYGSLPALQIDPTVGPLTDTEGAAILELLHDRMQWDNAGDGLLLAGSIVLGNICGALDIRPGLQITGPSQAGKSTMERTIIRPLQAGLGVRPSGATEAGIRQRMQSDALPVVIDESEQEAAKQREGHLKLLRLSFDGQEQIKGTAGGQALTYTMRSSITLIGINATIPNLADRNRLVVLRPRKLPPGQWAEFMLQRDALVTTEAGARLVRRSVSSLKALLANIKTFQSVVSGMGLAGRSAEVYGSLLAGAHHLTSTKALSPGEAMDWLDSKRWGGLDEETTEAIASDVEGRACLDHLLVHAVPWRGSQTGAIDVRELLAIVKGLRPAAATDGNAAKALGRLGVKLDHEGGLVVSRACTVFSGSRWANGAHHDRLLELEGATALSGPVRFAGGPNRRGVCIPLGLADL